MNSKGGLRRAVGSVLPSSRVGTFDTHVGEPGDFGGRGLSSRGALPKPPPCWAAVRSAPQWAPTVSARLPCSLSLLCRRGQAVTELRGERSRSPSPPEWPPQGNRSAVVVGPRARVPWKHAGPLLGALEGLGRIVVTPVTRLTIGNTNAQYHRDLLGRRPKGGHGLSRVSGTALEAVTRDRAF